MNYSHSDDANGTDQFIDYECFYEPPPLTSTRFWLVTVFGCAVSFVSIVENLMLFFIFITRKAHRSGHNFYLALLAFFDFFVSLAYILLMGVNVLSDFLQSPQLVGMWFSYMVPMITISHIAMSSASFLIIVATFERYCLTTTSRLLRFVQNNRKQIAFSAVVLAVVSKVTICIEFQITHHENCTGQMTEWQMAYSNFVFDTPYHIVWRFWYRNIVTIFAPFFILAFLNAKIVATISQTTTNGGVFAHLAGNLAMEQARRKATARAATRTMVAVTCCYLISNIVNVILTIWEHVDKQTLFQDYLNFYAIAVDMVSLLTTLACACRLPIYLYCQIALRTEILNIIDNCWKWWMRKFNPFQHYEYDDDDDQLHSSAYHTVTTSVETEKKRLSVSSPLLLSECPPPAIPIRNGQGMTPDKPVAVISAYQHFPRRSIDTLVHTNSDSSAGIKFVEKSGEYDDDLHSVLETGKETLL